MDIKEFRKELKDFIRFKNQKRLVKPYQENAKRLLQLSDEELDKWRKDNNITSYLFYMSKNVAEKEDKSKYNRLKRKSEDLDFEEFTEEEIEFIQMYEEEHNIKDSLLDSIF